MRCHYTYIPEPPHKVFIPGCWSAVVHGPDRCCCTPETFEQFEKEKYNRILNQKCDLINYLQKENASLNRIIKKLIKSNKQCHTQSKAGS